ncbi:MAG: hypothetical protein GY777_26215, partial [Candidatus Brocadiaceae bacterium]|nr:hypothetical protein [Candidatus Brocadiaceae bacterium]
YRNNNKNKKNFGVSIAPPIPPKHYRNNNKNKKNFGGSIAPPIPPNKNKNIYMVGNGKFS